MRLGFFLGFLIGAAVASVLSQRPAGDSDSIPSRPADQIVGGAIGKLRQKVREAMEAAREAADEKEAEMVRSYEEAREH